LKTNHLATLVPEVLLLVEQGLRIRQLFLAQFFSEKGGTNWIKVGDGSVGLRCNVWIL
jgi:hypothetical protein